MNQGMTGNLEPAMTHFEWWFKEELTISCSFIGTSSTYGTVVKPAADILVPDTTGHLQVLWTSRIGGSKLFWQQPKDRQCCLCVCVCVCFGGDQTSLFKLCYGDCFLSNNQTASGCSNTTPTNHFSEDQNNKLSLLINSVQYLKPHRIQLTNIHWLKTDSVWWKTKTSLTRWPPQSRLPWVTESPQT